MKLVGVLVQSVALGVFHEYQAEFHTSGSIEVEQTKHDKFQTDSRSFLLSPAKKAEIWMHVSLQKLQADPSLNVHTPAECISSQELGSLARVARVSEMVKCLAETRLVESRICLGSLAQTFHVSILASCLGKCRTCTMAPGMRPGDHIMGGCPFRLPLTKLQKVHPNHTHTCTTIGGLLEK